MPPQPTTTALGLSHSPTASTVKNLFLPNGSWLIKANKKRVGRGLSLRCNAVAKQSTQDNKEFLHKDLTAVKWHGFVSGDAEDLAPRIWNRNGTEEQVKTIRSMLSSMEDGEISISAYDTAWVALVEDLNGTGRPQFPESLEWIARNQLPDGSWGDASIFLSHDRIISTLACLIALNYWKLHADKQDKGMAFIKGNICKIGEENGEHMPIGFEVAFPSLIEKARNLGMEVPDECHPVLDGIYSKRRIKLTRIPREMLHTMPTTLLHSLEGMTGLDWERLLKLQSQDGSFLFSPASTAYALAQSRDLSCLRYLEKTVKRFKGGVPNVYPVDLFERIWAIDRLQRLGICRYFKHEIKECINYVYRYWTERGICWARNSEVQDIDDTAMGFRLLRLHGHQVSADVFENFKKDGEFFCFAGQSTQAVTGMYNLYRASQLQFPGEEVLEEARSFSSKYLRQKQSSNQLLDKWMVAKDLAGEVKYALDISWHGNLPRIETRFYIEQYGGDNDAWIGKTLYRMPNVSNNIYLELAMLDYNNCQALHRLEWEIVRRWHQEHNLRELGLRQRSLLRAYFLAAANVFEPERQRERLAWAKTTALIETISLYFGEEESSSSHEQRTIFTLKFHRCFTSHVYLNHQSGLDPTVIRQGPMNSLVATIEQLSLEAFMAHGTDIRHQLCKAWTKWLMAWEEDGDRYRWEAALVVRTVELCGRGWGAEETLRHLEYQRLLDITNRVCHRLGHLQPLKDQHIGSHNMANVNNRKVVESDMHELVELVLKHTSNDIDHGTKQMFLTVTKSFYYVACCSPKVVNAHIAKVLFHKVR